MGSEGYDTATGILAELLVANRATLEMVVSIAPQNPEGLGSIRLFHFPWFVLEVVGFDVLWYTSRDDLLFVKDMSLWQAARTRC